MDKSLKRWKNYNRSVYVDMINEFQDYVDLLTFMPKQLLIKS